MTSHQGFPPKLLSFDSAFLLPITWLHPKFHQSSLQFVLVYGVNLSHSHFIIFFQRLPTDSSKKSYIRSKCQQKSYRAWFVFLIFNSIYACICVCVFAFVHVWMCVIFACMDTIILFHVCFFCI